MATFWVNKSGNDANSGNSPSNAKKTIQAAINAATARDTIIIQSGVYNESMNMNLYGKTNITVKGDGVVILDGQNSLAYGATVPGLASNLIQNLIFMNYTYAGIFNGSRFAEFISNCIFINTNYGIRIEDNTGSGGGGGATNCVFVNLVKGWSGVNGGANQVFSKCTFVNCTEAVQLRSIYDSVTNSIFYGNATHINRAAGTSNKNLFYPIGVSNLLVNSGAPYTDIASWRTATGQDVNSDVADPLFIDPNNLLLGVQANSPARFASFNPNSLEQPYPFVGTGAINRRVGISNNVNSSIWTGGTFVNTQVVNDGGIQLIDPNSNGSWESGVIDLQTLSGFTPGPGQTLGLKLVDFVQSLAYPLRVLDSDNTDSKPNRLQYEIAFSNDGSNFGPYQKFEAGSIVNVPNRYCKIKITFRVDGIGA